MSAASYPYPATSACTRIGPTDQKALVCKLNDTAFVWPQVKGRQGLRARSIKMGGDQQLPLCHPEKRYLLVLPAEIEGDK